MANQEREKSQNCPVCLENLKQPRKLPTCKHVFCETCVSDSLAKLTPRSVENIENENESGFSCPVCRVVNQCPGNSEDLLTWISTLEIAEKAEVGLQVENMEVCMPCKKLNNTTRAVKYCMDCRESLCAGCFEETQKFRGLQEHTVVEINGDKGAHDNKHQRDMNQTLAEYLACTHHPDKNVTFICEDDGDLCCPTCILTNHRKCNKITMLQHLSKADSVKEVSKMGGSVKDLIDYCENIIEAIKETETENKTAAEKISQIMMDLRIKVNQLFDVLEESISQECKAVVKKYSISNETVIQEIQDVLSKLKFSSALLEEVSKSKQCQDNLVNVLLKRLQSRFGEFEIKVIEIAHGLKKFGFELQIESLLKDLVELDINDTARLASVKGNENKLTVPKYGGRKTLQYDLSKIGTFSIKNTNCLGSYPTYCDLTYTPENRLLLADSHRGYACLVSDTYRHLASCKFTTFSTGEGEYSTKIPFGVTYLQNGVMVVSEPKRKKLFVVKVAEKLEILAELESPHKAKAVRALNNGDLAVSWTEPVAFGIVSLSFCQLEEKSYFDRDKAGRVMKSFDYMAVDQKKSHVIQPCTVDKAVFCFDFQGNPIFEYRHDDLQQPTGVGIDASGNVYVCDLEKSSIHIMSSTGIPVRVYREGCPTRPLALGFDMDRTTFTVTHDAIYAKKRHEIHVFRLSE